ncbi:DUF2510 domain-containing protein [Skermania sp. ID1734]|nr:DUF2510 domain-containing protein [Skermania sp. ID1734]
MAEVAASAGTVPAGWYPDPHVPGVQRWWDGRAWSDAKRSVARQP